MSATSETVGMVTVYLKLSSEYATLHRPCPAASSTDTDLVVDPLNARRNFPQSIEFCQHSASR